MGTSEVIEPHSATQELQYVSKISDFRTHLMKMHSALRENSAEDV